uniref:Uncharacterized protein n=1 Tax=Dicentrarchus labrax TaxID=13489 RepID=A0A8P4GMB4_DICLA
MLGLVTAMTKPKCVRMRGTGCLCLSVCRQSPATVPQTSLWGCLTSWATVLTLITSKCAI